MPIEPTTDREFLIEINGKLDALLDQVKEVKSELDRKSSLTFVKAVEQRVNNLEKDLKGITRKVYTFAGGISVIIFLVEWLIKHG